MVKPLEILKLIIAFLKLQGLMSGSPISFKGQHILNVGSGVPINVIEVAQEIVNYLKSTSEIKISGAFREGDIRHNYADLKLIELIATEMFHSI